MINNNIITNIAIIGLGYVGFPLAVQAAYRGFSVTGVDTNPETVEAVNAKKHFLEDPFVAERLPQIDLRATTTMPSSDAYIVCVPTPVRNFSEPDLTFVKKAVEAIGNVLQDLSLIHISEPTRPY